MIFVTAHLGGPHGSAKSARDFARALLATDDDVHIVSPRTEDFGAHAAGYELSTPTWHRYPRATVRHRSWKALVSALRRVIRRFALSRVMAGRNVIVNGWASYGYWKELSVNDHRQSAIIIRESPRHFEGDDRSEGLAAMLSGFAEFDRLIFVSDRHREEWARFAELADKPAFYLPNCCEEEEVALVRQSDRLAMRKRMGLAEDDLVLICPGAIEKRKGQDIILNSWSQVLEVIPNARLLLLGDGCTVWGKSIAADVDSGKYGDRVTRMPSQPSALGYLHAADILLFPSRAEAMPRTVLEAMALAMPIIATYVDGIPELIEDGVSGRLFDPEDTSSMFEALISITSQADVACQFARAARQRYEIMFSRRKHIERARCMLAWLGARAQVPSAMTGQDYDREQP